MLVDTIKEQILQRSKELNLSIASLEKKAGLPLNSLRNLTDGGSQNPGVKSLVAIAQALGCGIDDLLDRQLVSKREISVKAAGKNKLISELFNETVATLNACIKQSKVEISFEQFIELLRKSYIYALHKNAQKVCVGFIEGLIADRLN